MRNMVRPAGQTRGLAEADDRTVDLVNEEITAFEQTPEDSAEAVPIDAIERQKPFNEFACRWETAAAHLRRERSSTWAIRCCGVG